MKIATYNLWNDDRGMPQRLQHVFEELKAVDADIWCLQDVFSDDFCEAIARECGCGYFVRGNANLAIVSKFPVARKADFDFALMAEVKYKGLSLYVTDVHLASESIMSCENTTIAVVKEHKNVKADYCFLCGDFNCSDDAALKHFLWGDQTLNGQETTPRYWNDLARTWQELTGFAPQKTLDFATNPRWKAYGYKEGAGVRMDCIMLRETYPKPTPAIVNAERFGMKIHSDTGFCASDHYGYLAELDMAKVISTL